MSVRDTLVEKIRSVVGPDVAVIDVEDNRDVLGKITIMVKQRRLLPLPAAPNGAMQVEYLITVTHPALSPAVSEPELDEFVPSFLDDMRTESWFAWTDAVKNSDSINLAYDINAWVIASAATTQPPARTGTDTEEPSDG